MIQHLFLSPHFDDAIGSCGGTIWRLASRGIPVRVMTAFGGPEREPLSMPATVLHNEWRLERPVNWRRLEDASACRLLKCESSFFEFSDAIYRQDSDGRHLYPTFESLRASIAHEDQALAGQLASQLRAYLAEMGTVVFCPMGIGGHVDHILAKNCGGLLKIDSVCVLYYRDFSYDRAWDDDFDHLALEHVSVKLSREELDKKITAFSEYKSQISEVFGSRAGMVAYFEEIGNNESIFLSRQPPRARLEMLRNVLKPGANTSDSE